MHTYQQALSALADPTRAAIVERLRARPTSVSDLARGLPVSRPAVSQHLRVLENAGLVSVRTVGTRRIYALDATRIRQLRDHFDGWWRSALEAFKQAADEEADSARRKGGAG